jgi:para-nitrobenzyl esterase
MPAFSAAEDTLSDQLVAAWTNFAATGNPNPKGDNSPWPRFISATSTAPEFLSEDVPALTTFTWSSFGAAHNCDFWDTIIAYQPPL